MRLIEFDDVVERLGAFLMADAQTEYGGLASEDIEDWKALAKDILNGSPTIDAVSVVHGHWIDRNGNIVAPFWERYECSVCGARSDYKNYCHYCGAKMDGEAKE